MVYWESRLTVPINWWTYCTFLSKSIQGESVCTRLCSNHSQWIYNHSKRGDQVQNYLLVLVGRFGLYLVSELVTDTDTCEFVGLALCSECPLKRVYLKMTLWRTDLLKTTKEPQGFKVLKKSVFHMRTKKQLYEPLWIRMVQRIYCHLLVIGKQSKMQRSALCTRVPSGDQILLRSAVH